MLTTLGYQLKQLNVQRQSAGDRFNCPLNPPLIFKETPKTLVSLTAPSNLNVPVQAESKINIDLHDLN